MIKDARKSLDLSYNSLNLLSEVKQGSSIKAKYIYAADGTKLAVSDASNNGYAYRGSLISKRTSNVLSLESTSFFMWSELKFRQCFNHNLSDSRINFIINYYKIMEMSNDNYLIFLF